MPLLTPPLLNNQEQALQLLLNQVEAQIASLQNQIGAAQSNIGLMQAQLAAAQIAAATLTEQITQLEVAQASATAVDNLTLVQYTWTQDPDTQAWTGVPVSYPGIESSKIAVYGGTGTQPVLQTIPVPA